jgi:hypothetical protein
MATIFQDGTLWTQTKLDMINTCLLAIGEVPFPAGTATAGIPEGTDGYIAKIIVEETMIEVCNKSWWFNTEKDASLIPDATDRVVLPPNILRIDSSGGNYFIKAGRVYDSQQKTDVFESAVTLDLFYLVDFADLPPSAFRYVSLRAARKFQQRVVGSQELHTFSLQDELDAHDALKREHMQYRNYNLIEGNRIISRTQNPRGL